MNLRIVPLIAILGLTSCSSILSNPILKQDAIKTEQDITVDSVKFIEDAEGIKTGSTTTVSP